jgi:hypothetical protein
MPQSAVRAFSRRELHTITINRDGLKRTGVAYEGKNVPSSGTEGRAGCIGGKAL